MEGDSGLVRAQLPGNRPGSVAFPGNTPGSSGTVHYGATTTLHHWFILTCKTARSSGSGNIIPPQVQSLQERI